MSIHVLPLAHGDCPTLICESAEVCYFGDWRVDIDPPKTHMDQFDPWGWLSSHGIRLQIGIGLRLYPLTTHPRLLKSLGISECANYKTLSLYPCHDA